MENNELIKVLVETLQDGKAFVIDQAPLYAQELIRWEICKGYVGIGVLLTLAVISCIISRMIYNKIGNDRDGIYQAPLILAGIFLVVTVAPLMCLVKAKVAPRVVIIGEISKELKCNRNHE